MLQLAVLALAVLLFEVPDVYCRPRDQSHKGLYDEWKTVPFVDNPEHTGDMFGEYVTKLGNSDSTNKLHDKYQELYEKYNKEHDRVIGDGNYTDASNETNDSEVHDYDKDIKPVEGGLEDMTSEWSEGKVKNGRKHRRGRENRKTHRHHKSVKKDLTEDEKKKRELRREKKRKDRKSKQTTDPVKPKSYDRDYIDLDKFYKEHPDFKKNVATISDTAKESNHNPTTTDTYATSDSLVNTITENTEKNIPDISESEDDADQKDADDFDEDDDMDDDEETAGEESESNDESSEEFAYYDYYDEDGDSSYSSSEVKAEQEMLNQTPYDWFQQYDRMYGDQPVQTKTQLEKANDNTKAADMKDKKNVDGEKVVKEEKNIPKTDVEPSTSPNPPTPKKDIKSTVTQPAYPEWKERVETWNLIESKPVESCSENADCASGRMCKFGLCLCGQPDFCDGHYKPVCGSDGRLYPSHCELHRTACVLGVHIRLDHESKCGIKVDGILDIQKEDDRSTSLATSVNDPETEEMLETTTAVAVDATTSLSEDDKKDTEVQQKIDTKLEAAFDDLKPQEQKNDNNYVDEGTANTGEESDISKEMNALMNQQPVKESKEDSSTGPDDDDDDDDDDTDDDDEIDSDDDSYEYDDEEDYDDDDDDVSSSTEEKSFGGKFDFEADYDSSEDEYDDEDYEDSDEDDSDDEDVTNGSSDSSDKESAETSESDEPSLVPLFCTPDRYQKFKADVLEYHCIYFEEQHCDRQTQEEKQKLAAVMYNYFDRDLSGYVEMEELWEMQLLERMDELSSLCTLLDLATFDELGERDGKLSVDEFIQAFDIPDLLEHKTEVVPLLATVGNGLEVKCDITESTDIVWQRNDIDLSLIDFPGISVLGDGSLYIETIGFPHVGNLSCHDRQKPSIKQIHMLTVHKPPHMNIHIESHEQVHGVNFEIRCHAEGYPKPAISWVFEDQPVKQGAKYHIQNYDNTLVIQDPDFVMDTGVYKCHGRNTAGESIASVTVTVHSPNNTKNLESVQFEESFIIFHDNGYTMHEPNKCLTQRHVLPEFGNFYFIPDELDDAPSLCEPGIPCVWGAAINVRDTFVFATQPRQNRVVVIDVEDTFNPNQVIFTDHMPVSIHYVAHLDEVWVLCWNGEDDNGSKTVVIIRNASQRTQHHSIHTQPIGNRFDQVQDIFLPEDNELHHPYKYGYTVHSGQQGLFKVNLEEKKYTRAVDFTKYDCVPQSVAFVPLGGHSLIQCVKKTSSESIIKVLTLDYITDTVIDNITLSAVPYMSPDVSNVVMVVKETGRILVHQITENGEIVHQFDVSVGSPVGQVAFHKGRYSHGYDLYLTSTKYPQIYAVSLENGKVDIIKDIGQPDSEMFLPWFKEGRPLVSGDMFSDFLGTTAMSSMLILNGRHHSLQCDYRDLENPAVVTYTHLRT